MVYLFIKGVHFYKYNADFNQLEEAISFSYELFEKHPFGRYSNGESSKSFNRCIFELFSYYFSDSTIRAVVSKNKNMFIDEFKKLNDKPEFIQTIEGYPKMTEKVVGRFNQFADLLKKIDIYNNLTCIQKFRSIGSGIEVVE